MFEVQITFVKMEETYKGKKVAIQIKLEGIKPYK